MARANCQVLHSAKIDVARVNYGVSRWRVA
jgi:hypothetical protein